MKRFLLVLALLVFGLVSYSAAQCTTLKDGVIYYSDTHFLKGQLIKPGFDEYGYNYQAHLFNGYYCNAYLGGADFPPYEGDEAAYLAANPTVISFWAWQYKDNVAMKWNDAWLANGDCDNDGILDRHYGYPSYIGSGAWETNHQSGSYAVDNKTYHWTYFVKIIAVPADAVKEAGVWYTMAGKEIGPEIWGEFAITEEIYNDSGAGLHGIQYKSPARAGLGNWK